MRPEGTHIWQPKCAKVRHIPNKMERGLGNAPLFLVKKENNLTLTMSQTLFLKYLVFFKSNLSSYLVFYSTKEMTFYSQDMDLNTFSQGD